METSKKTEKYLITDTKLCSFNMREGRQSRRIFANIFMWYGTRTFVSQIKLKSNKGYGILVVSPHLAQYSLRQARQILLKVSKSSLWDFV